MVVASASVFVNLQRHVTLVLDGRTRIVSTFASTVGDLLEAQGIRVGPHDEVRPAPETAISDGLEVQYLKAKAITLLLNGDRRVVYVTGQTVDDVLEQINLRMGTSSLVGTSRGADIEEGQTIVLNKAVAVTVKIRKEKPFRLITNAPRIGYLLDSLGIILDKHDQVRPRVKRVVTSGLQIAVVRVSTRRVTTRRSIPYHTRTVRSDSLVQGSQEVRQAGRAGVERVKLLQRFENGRKVHEKVIRRKVIRKPVERVVVVGTAPPHSQTGGASWYERTGMVAAHRTLPFGTHVRVTNLSNGKSVSVTINDRGPYVSGRIIDLSDDAFAQLAPLGSGTIQVRITW